MISLDRLLDGLEVTVEPFVAPAAPRMTGRIAVVAVRIGGRRTRMLPLAGGACLRIARRSVTVVPPSAARAVAPASPVRQRLPSMRATFGTINLFGRLTDSLVEKVRPGDRLGAAFAELLEEVDCRGPGTRAMVEILLRRALILFLRRWGEEGNRLFWLVPIGDEGIERAVSAMHDRPEQSFTLHQLSELAGMSRSVFAVHFRDAVGQTPMEFLKTVRLDRASQLLTRTDLPLKAVAARAGYSSRSAFSRAFRARNRAAPAAYRAAGARAVRRPGSDARSQRRPGTTSSPESCASARPRRGPATYAWSRS